MCVCACVYMYVYICVCAKSFPTLCTPWTVACQAPLSMRFSRQEYWSGLLFPPPGIKPTSPVSPALAGGFFNTEPLGKAIYTCVYTHTYTHTHTHTTDSQYYMAGNNIIKQLSSN